MSTLYQLSGLFLPMAGTPGFRVPLFAALGTDFVQVVSADTRVIAFYPAHYDRSALLHQPLTASYLTQRGGLALFAFKDFEGATLIGDQPILAQHLRATLDNYKPNPYLYYDVVEFIGDKNIINQASDKVHTHLMGSTHPDRAAKAYPGHLSADFNYNMFTDLSDAIIKRDFLPNLEREYGLAAFSPVIDSMKKGGGASILQTPDRSAVKEIQQHMRRRTNVQVDVYVYYYFAEYSGAQIVMAVSENPLRGSFTPATVEAELADLSGYVQFIL